MTRVISVMGKKNWGDHRKASWTLDKLKTGQTQTIITEQSPLNI